MNRNGYWEMIVDPEQPIPLSQLEIEVTRGSPLTLINSHPELYKETLAYWNKAQVCMMLEHASELTGALEKKDEAALAKMWGRIGGDGLKYGLLGASLEGKKLHLTVNTVTYRDSIGTNWQAHENPDFREKMIQAGIKDNNDPNFYFGNPLATSAAIYGINGDGKMYTAVGLRGSRMIVYPSTHHVFGGTVDFDKAGTAGNFGAQIAKELEEEVGLVLGEDLGEPSFIGVVRHGCSRLPEVILSVPLRVGRGELISRWKEKAADKYEHRRIAFYEFDKVEEFLERHLEQTIPSGAAALSQLVKYQESLRLAL